MAVEHVAAHDHRYTTMTVRECARSPAWPWKPHIYWKDGHPILRLVGSESAVFVTAALRWCTER